MKERQAITVARRAVADATTHVGVHKEALQQELERRMREEPELFEAFALAGQSMLERQESKH
jgi:hypothetical protein